MILSPFRTGVSAAGSTENWDDHLSGLGLVIAVMADLRNFEDLLPRAYGRMRLYLQRFPLLQKAIRRSWSSVLEYSAEVLSSLSIRLLARFVCHYPSLAKFYLFED